MWEAGRSLVEIGGIDLSASLAYFMLLSFFPLLALIVIGFATFADPEIIRERLLNILTFYFPASRDFLTSALQHLFNAGLAAGVIAIVGMLLGANGLFMAANRSINRVFGCRPRKVVGATLVEIGLATIVVLLFLLSLSLTLAFQVALTVSEAIPSVGGSVSGVLLLVTQLLSATLPVFLTAMVFAIVYQMLPSAPVKWSDAAFGAIVAVILFEAAKNLFFWFGAIASQRSLLYGPISSVIIVLVWSNVAGLIFLYGAALARESGSLRSSMEGEAERAPLE